MDSSGRLLGMCIGPRSNSVGLQLNIRHEAAVTACCRSCRKGQTGGATACRQCSCHCRTLTGLSYVDQAWVIKTRRVQCMCLHLHGVLAIEGFHS